MHRNTQSSDEGFTDDESQQDQMGSIQLCEGESISVITLHGYGSNFLAELVYKLLASLPRSRLAIIQRRIAPLLQFDVVGVRSSLRTTPWLSLTLFNQSIVSSGRGIDRNILLSSLYNLIGLCTREQTLESPCKRPKPLEESLPSSRLGVASDTTLTYFQYSAAQLSRS